MMERNAGDLAPKGEVPTEAEFARFLCDKTFVDYFNAFLSLPVFSQRLLYRFAAQTFDLDPPLQRSQYRLDRLKLMRWVRTHRASYFFKSDLYLEYILCKHLQKSQLHLTFFYGDDKGCARDRILDRQLLDRWLGRISGMHKFRKFLSQTAGEKCIHFWMDSERMKFIDGKDECTHFIRDMEAKYFSKDQFRNLPGLQEWEQNSRAQSPIYTEKYRRLNRFATAEGQDEDTCNKTDIIDKISTIQGFLLRNIQNYWVPRFFIHCKIRYMTNSPSIQAYQPNMFIVEVRSLSELSKIDKGDKPDRHVSEHAMINFSVKNPKLKKQSVSNLMSMFSSSMTRNSEISTMIKLEDTGKTNEVMLRPSEEDSKYDHREWLAEEFPLSDISEESVVSSSTKSSDDLKESKSDQRFFESVASTSSPEPSDTDKSKDAATPLTEQSRVPSNRSTSELKSVSNMTRREHSKSNLELRREKMHTVTTEYDKKSVTNLSGKQSPVSKHKEEITPTETTNKQEDVTFQQEDESRKITTPCAPSPSRSTRSGPLTSLMGNHESNICSLSRGSLANISVAGSSRRRVSLPNSSHHINSSSSIGSSSQRLASTPAKKPTFPKGSGRSMSISFRLADLSYLMDGGNNWKQNGKGENEKAESSTVLHTLDLEALKALREQVEKKKIKERKRLAKLRKKRKSKTPLNNTDGSNDTGKQKKGSRSKGTQENDKVKGQKTEVERLTKGNLAKFNLRNAHQDHRFNNRHNSDNMRDFQKHIRTEMYPDNFRLHDDKRMTKTSTKTYSELSFSEKIERDENSLSVIPKLPSLSALLPHKVTLNDELRHHPNLGDEEYHRELRHINGAALSDCVAGKPWEAFITKQGRYLDLHYLKFWQKAQEYLVYVQNDLFAFEKNVIKNRLARRIVADFLTSSGNSFVNLGDRLTSDIRNDLRRGVASQLLIHAQDLASGFLKDSWMQFQKSDIDDFLTRTTYRKNFARASLLQGTEKSLLGQDSITERDSQISMSSQQSSNHMLNMLKKVQVKNKKGKTQQHRKFSTAEAPHRMWRALELSQGTSNLVTEEGEVSEPSDPENDSDDEGSLRKPKIFVYKEREIQKLPDSQLKPRCTYPPAELKREKRGAISVKTRTRSDLTTVTTSRPKETKAVCTAIRKNGTTIFRPPRPKAFQDVLRDQGHIEFFRRFLIRENNELTLQFWLAVDYMRTTSRDAKSRQNKTILIVRNFFGTATDFGAALQTDADVIKDIPTMEKVTPQMLLSAQACVARTMEENWFEEYRDTFPEEDINDSDDDESSAAHNIAPREKTRALWAMFINKVISFRRGLMNKLSFRAFKEFIGKEVSKEVEKQKQTGLQGRRLISNKVIIVDKLLNDLSFWIEVERFKELADNAARAASAGTYTLEDEDYVQQKARTIIDCFLQSQVLPKVQINVPQEMADEILESADGGLIERGLFHDAALYIFTVILYCWKRFCHERFAPPESESVEVITDNAIQKRRRKKRKSSTPTVCGVKIKTIIGTSVDEPPTFHFTLQHGLQLVLPPKPRQEDVPRQRFRQLLYQLYPNADEATIESYLRQHLGEREKANATVHQHLRRFSRVVIPNLANTRSGIQLNNMLHARRMSRKLPISSEMTKDII